MEYFPGQLDCFLHADMLRDRFPFGQPGRREVLLLRAQVGRAQEGIEGDDQACLGFVVRGIGAGAHFALAIRGMHRSKNFAGIDDSFHFQ